MSKRLLVGLALALLLPAWALAQAVPLTLPIPVDVIAGPAPQPVTADGRVRLLYELRVTNFGAKPMTLDRLEALGDGRPIAAYNGEDVDKLLMPIGPADPAAEARVLAPGRGAIVFLDLALEPGAPTPTRLSHRLIASAEGGAAETVDGPSIAVSTRAPLVIRPPLRGSGWAAIFGLSDPGHRRVVVPANGRAFIINRFAIDWVKFGPDGRFYRGDPSVNSSFYDYGAEVLAVGDGRIVGLKDGIPDNAGLNRQRAVPMTVRTISGNSVVLDLGHGRYAFYEHLQPGSLRVRLGQRVRAGQVLARLGDSGNAMAPHLHFQLADGPEHLKAEGIPYEIDAFTQLGAASGIGMVLENQAWTAGGVKPIPRRREFPLDNAVIDFR